MNDKGHNPVDNDWLLEDIIDEVHQENAEAPVRSNPLRDAMQTEQANFYEPPERIAEQITEDMFDRSEPSGFMQSGGAQATVLDQPKVLTNAMPNDRHTDFIQEEPDMSQKKTSKKTTHKAGRSSKIVAAVLGVVALLTSVATGYTYLYSGIHLGVRAGAVPVGGMSVAEAGREIDNAAQKLLAGKAITLSIHDTDYEVDIDSVTDGFDSKDSAQDAYQYTHAGNPATRVMRAVGALFGGHEVPLSVSVNRETLTEKLDEISEQALTEPVEPSWTLDGDKLVIDAGKPGIGFDTKKVATLTTDKIRTMDFEAIQVDVTKKAPQKIDVDAIQQQAQADAQNATVDKKDGKTIIPSVDGVKFDLDQAKAIVGDATAQTYEIPVTRTPAEITADKLADVLFSDTLASTSTNLNSGNKQRTNNVRLACEHINGTILNPGDEFSYNTVVGERTAARGFRTAGAYANGRVVDEVGGGVCQPSSTLYMAVLRADLAVTERRNHSFTVAYTPLGEDATVSWGGPDFRFKNNTKYPIKILASQSGDSMSMTIKGTKTSDKTVSLKTEVLSTLNFETIEKADATLAAGARNTSQTGATGYKTVTYKTVTENGESKTEKANNSYYKKRDKIILVGPTQTPPVEKQPESSNNKAENHAPVKNPSTAADPEGR